MSGARPDTIALGRYPSPVFRADPLCTTHVELYVKNDGVVSERYGGNKVRKLELVLADALRRGARRLVTVAAAGSHHALATALFARDVGVDAAAVLCPQPWTEHAEQTLRAALAAGLRAHPASPTALAPLALARLARRGDYFVPPGASGPVGTVGYARAAGELAGQIRAGELPEPDVIVVALGSGGTAAGLLAGIAREGLPTELVGVDVTGLGVAAAPLVLGLAWAALRREGGGQARAGTLARRLRVDHNQLGAGYGVPTAAGRRAAAAAAEIGLELDPSYTQKAFAAALDLVGRGGQARGARARPFPAAAGKGHCGGPLRVLYWHTLSAVPLAPLLRDAPPRLPGRLGRLLRHAPPRT